MILIILIAKNSQGGLLISFVWNFKTFVVVLIVNVHILFFGNLKSLIVRGMICLELTRRIIINFGFELNFSDTLLSNNSNQQYHIKFKQLLFF